MYRITANAAYQKLRGRKEMVEVSWEDVSPRFDEEGRHLGPVEDWSGRLEDPALQDEARRVIAEAVETLPPDCRVAFIFHDVEERPNPEIAEMLGLTLPAVKSRVHRARLALRRALAEYFRPREEEHGTRDQDR